MFDNQKVVWLSLLAGLAVAGTYSWFVGQQWFLIDDSFITFRYARNLIDGHGIVWNLGERVEGYTNFLWVLAMAAGIAARVPPEILSNVVGALSGFGILGLLVFHSAKIHGWRSCLIWLAPAALVVHRSFTAWSTGGLETQFFSFLVLTGYLLLTWEVEDETDSIPWRPFLFLGLATLTRPEGAIFAFWGGLCLLPMVKAGKISRLRLILAVCPYVLIVGLHLLWRNAYYDAWLPNTFHAKVNGFWFEQSGRYFSLFVSDFKLHYFAPLIAAPIIWRHSFDDRLFSGAVALYLLYVSSIGGDRFEFRFLVVVLPYLYWLAAEGIGLVAAKLASHFRLAKAAAFLGGASLVAVTLWGSQRPEARELRKGVNSLVRMKAFANLRIEQGKALRSFVDRGLLPEDLRISVGGAGALPYYTEWYTLDYYGLNDREVARERIGQREVVGHEHQASLELMRAKRIVAFDPINRMYVEGKPKLVQFEVRRLEERIEEESGSETFGLRPECFELGPFEYLIFATPQTEKEVRAVLPELQPCEFEGLGSSG